MALLFSLRFLVHCRRVAVERAGPLPKICGLLTQCCCTLAVAIDSVWEFLCALRRFPQNILRWNRSHHVAMAWYVDSSAYSEERCVAWGARWDV